MLFYLTIGELLLLTLSASVYSYFVWKADPQRKQGENADNPTPGVIPGLRITAILTVVLMLGGTLAAFYLARCSHPAADFTARTSYCLDALARGDAQAAERDFTSVMRAALPPNALEDIWRGLVNQHGAFQRIQQLRPVNCWPYTQVYATVRFERANVTMRFVFDRAGHIAGLWLVRTVPAYGS